MTQRTTIRQMWEYGANAEGSLVLAKPLEGWTCKGQSVLVVPYNPTCRLATIKRTTKTLWPRAKGKRREEMEALVMYVLGTALTPSRRPRWMPSSVGSTKPGWF
jgi:hypothetical protein